MSKFLYKFIQSLNKAEKRLFKDSLKSSKRKSYYLEIINEYSAVFPYSIHIDKTIFGSKDNKYISDCKSRLKQALFHFLTEIYHKNNINKKIQNLVSVVQMLIDRFEMKEASKILLKAEKLAIDNEAYYQLMMIQKLKISVAEYTISVGDKIDFNLIKNMQLLRYETIENYKQLCAVHDKRLTAKLKKFNANQGYSIVKNRSVDLPKIKDKLKIKFGNHQINYNQHLASKKYKSALASLHKIIYILDQNTSLAKSLVLANKHYCIYLSALCYLNVKVGRTDEIPAILKKIESYQPNSILGKLRKDSSLFISTCLYTLATQKIEMGLKFIDEKTDIIKKLTKKAESINNTIFCVLTHYFASNQWNKCLKLIQQVYQKELYKENNYFIPLINLIAVYESNDEQYFFSLLEQYRNKLNRKTKKEKFVLALVYFLEHIYTFDRQLIKTNLHKVYLSFEKNIPQQRYFIYWIINRFCHLKDEDYFAFLKAHSFEHYEPSIKQNLHELA